MTNSREILIAHFNELEDRFGVLYLSVLHEATLENIHAIRLCVKELNAFFNLLNVLNNEFNAEQATQVLSPLYKMAGRLRVLQLESKQLQEKKAEKSKRFKWLSARIDEKKAQFKKIEKKYPLAIFEMLSEAVHFHLSALDEASIEAGWERYFQMVFARLFDAISNGADFDNQLHQFRLFVKEFRFNLKLFDQFYEKKAIEPLYYEVLDEMQKTLGNWHDAAFLLQKSDYHPAKFRHQIEKEERKRLEEVYARVSAFSIAMSELKQKIGQLLQSEELIAGNVASQVFEDFQEQPSAIH